MWSSPSKDVCMYVCVHLQVLVWTWLLECGGMRVSLSFAWGV